MTSKSKFVLCSALRQFARCSVDWRHFIPQHVPQSECRSSDESWPNEATPSQHGMITLRCILLFVGARKWDRALLMRSMRPNSEARSVRERESASEKCGSLDSTCHGSAAALSSQFFSSQRFVDVWSEWKYLKAKHSIAHITTNQSIAEENSSGFRFQQSSHFQRAKSQYNGIQQTGRKRQRKWEEKKVKENIFMFRKGNTYGVDRYVHDILYILEITIATVDCWFCISFLVRHRQSKKREMKCIM